MVIFVIGGIARSEIRTAHQLTEQLGRDVVLGSTSILTPSSFLANLKVWTQNTYQSAFHWTKT